jgi:Right handed beta helix region
MRRINTRIRAAALLSAAALLAVACSSSDDESSPETQASAVAPSIPIVTDTMPSTTLAPIEGTINVPEDFATIQEAVDAAAPGAMILIAPGTYTEAVNVTTDNLTIRGLDRNEVVLDGGFELDNGIRVLGAKGVAIENMTAINYTGNGFFWTGVEGYRGSYLTAYRTGDYGVYAFDSTVGQLDHIYAAGSPDAGVYIGQCFPCDALITDVVSEYNGLGYSGTNSGGNLLIINSVFRNNRAGLVTNSATYELCYPARQTTFVGNLVYSNNNPNTPAIDDAILAMGNGLVVSGGIGAVVERNRVWDHDRGGITIAPFPEDDPSDAQPGEERWAETCAESKTRPVEDVAGPLIWQPIDNRVIGNVVEDSRVADLLHATIGADLATLGNCFSGNTFATSAPSALETLAPCDATGSGDWSAGQYDILQFITDVKPPSVDWQTAPTPDLQPQENMPDAATAPARPATDVPTVVDIAAIVVPEKPAA